MLASPSRQVAEQLDRLFANDNGAFVYSTEPPWMNDGRVGLMLTAGWYWSVPSRSFILAQTVNTRSCCWPRNLVVLDEGASATLIERFIGNTDTVYFHNHVSEIVVGSQASLKHYRIQYESRQAYHLSSVYLSQQAESSRYRGITVNLVWQLDAHRLPGAPGR